jgi:hypothetical protein
MKKGQKLYDKQKEYEKIIELATSESFTYIEQVIAHSPMGRDCFYEYYPIGSEEMDNIKEILFKNKAIKSTKLLKKLEEEGAAGIIASLKLLLPKSEAKKLFMNNFNENKKQQSNVNVIVTPQEAAEIAKQLKNEY